MSRVTVAIDPPASVPAPSPGEPSSVSTRKHKGRATGQPDTHAPVDVIEAPNTPKGADNA